MNLTERYRHEARLVILKALSEQPDSRLNSALLVSVLETYAITRSRDWVHEELRWLADVGAVNLADIGSVRIATLTSKGLDHVERRIRIEGIRPPSPPEA